MLLYFLISKSKLRWAVNLPFLHPRVRLVQRGGGAHHRRAHRVRRAARHQPRLHRALQLLLGSLYQYHCCFCFQQLLWWVCCILWQINIVLYLHFKETITSYNTHKTNGDFKISDINSQNFFFIAGGLMVLKYNVFGIKLTVV